ncbi:hypothetical protein Taro_015598 [Colocasia esculenta]|uniref:CCHC-type domain-containing protein n=1 Tax=Colocasia esculenta TaxID=4460 RepID=A0A843UI86_COLES|nr:hypothetical protein [Colocasia esculenta]
MAAPSFSFDGTFTCGAALRRLLDRCPALASSPALASLPREVEELEFRGDAGVADRVSSALAQPFLHPDYTIPVVGCFRPVCRGIVDRAVDLLRRARGPLGPGCGDTGGEEVGEGDVEVVEFYMSRGCGLRLHELACFALSRALDLAPFLLRSVLNYFGFSPPPFQRLLTTDSLSLLIEKDDDHLLNIVRLSFRFLQMEPDIFSKFWDWSCFLDLVQISANSRVGNIMEWVGLGTLKPYRTVWWLILHATLGGVGGQEGLFEPRMAESGRVADSAPADPDPESGRSRAVDFANLVLWAVGPGSPSPERAPPSDVHLLRVLLVSLLDGLALWSYQGSFEGWCTSSPSLTSRPPPTCFRCGKRDYLRRDCQVRSQQTGFKGTWNRRFADAVRGQGKEKRPFTRSRRWVDAGALLAEFVARREERLWRSSKFVFHRGSSLQGVVEAKSLKNKVSLLLGGSWEAFCVTQSSFLLVGQEERKVEELATTRVVVVGEALLRVSRWLRGTGAFSSPSLQMDASQGRRLGQPMQETEVEDDQYRVGIRISNPRTSSGPNLEELRSSSHPTPTIGDLGPVLALEACLDLPNEVLTTGHPPSGGGKGKEPLNLVPALHEGPSSPLGTGDSGRTDNSIPEQQGGGDTEAPRLQEYTQKWSSIAEEGEIPCAEKRDLPSNFQGFAGHGILEAAFRVDGFLGRQD